MSQGDVTPVPAERSTGRTVVVWILIVVASLLTIFAAGSIWVRRQALDTENWVAVSDELLQDPTVQDTLSTYLVNELFTVVDIQAALSQLLPQGLQGLAAPAAAALQRPVTDAVEDLLQTERFQTLWRNVNQRAHAALVRVLRDETRVGSTAGGQITISLGELVRAVGERLGLSQSTLDQIPPDAGTVVVAESAQLAQLQTAVRVLRVSSLLLAVLVVALYGLAIFLARGARREALRNIGWALIVVGLVLLVGRRLGLDYAVASVQNPSYRPAAQAAFAIGTELVAQMAWAGVLYGAIIVLGAVLAGPTRIATTVRRVIAPALNASPWLVWGGAVIVFLLIVLWSPTPAFDSLPAVLLLAALFFLGVWALRRQTLREFPAARVDEAPVVEEAGTL